jgi:hypothetical protein
VPLHQGSDSRAGATAVVLPAPGGAINTALVPLRNAASKTGMAAAIGKVWAVVSVSALIMGA